MTRFSLSLAALAVTLAFVPTAAVAAKPLSRSEAAQRSLDHAVALRHGRGAHSGRDFTVALAELFRQYSSLDTAGRKRAQELVARPTDGTTNPDGDAHTYTVPEVAPICSTHFCIHYVTSTADAPDLTDANADGKPDSVQRMLTVFESEVEDCENGKGPSGCLYGGTAGLDWPAPVNDGGLGGDARTDIYIEDLFPSQIFGYAAPDATNDFQHSNSFHGYLVMDKDFSRFSNVLTGDEEMRVTAAHEYNHVLQFGMDGFEDTWMFESTATYFENKVYPSIDDYLGYLNDWVNLTAQPLTAAPADDPNTVPHEDLKIYGSAVWNHFVDARWQNQAIRSAWQQSATLSPTPSFAPDAYGKAIADLGGAGFASEFDDLSTAVAEWEAPDNGFPDLYPDVERVGTLVSGSSPSPASFALDHTTFALLDVPIPAGSPAVLTLSASLPSGLNGAIALVARTGSNPTGGTVTTVTSRTANGGALQTTLPDPGTYGRITAVLVNADPAQNGFVGGDWHFTKDNEQFTQVKATTSATEPTGAPLPLTGSATSVGDSSATLNGTIFTGGADTTVHFEYGTTPAYGHSTADNVVTDAVGNAGAPVPAAPIPGLSPGTIYHYRLVAKYSVGATFVGSDHVLTTTGGPVPPLPGPIALATDTSTTPQFQPPPAPQPSPTLAAPVVATGAATGIGAESATLNGTVDPQGQLTTFQFEYGTTTAYGHSAPVVAGNAGSARQALAVTAPVTTLKPGTTIHFRVLATNPSGTSRGADQTFRTKALTVAAAVTKTKLRAALSKGIRARLRCNANCSVRVELLLPAKLAKRLHMKRKVAGLKLGANPAGKAARLRFAKAIARKLSRQSSIKFTLKLTATTTTGGRRTVSKPLALR